MSSNERKLSSNAEETHLPRTFPIRLCKPLKWNVPIVQFFIHDHAHKLCEHVYMHRVRVLHANICDHGSPHGEINIKIKMRTCLWKGASSICCWEAEMRKPNKMGQRGKIILIISCKPWKIPLPYVVPLFPSLVQKYIKM
jgi:hypothetical protein